MADSSETKLQVSKKSYLTFYVQMWNFSTHGVTKLEHNAIQNNDEILPFCMKQFCGSSDSRKTWQCDLN